MKLKDKMKKVVCWIGKAIAAGIGALIVLSLFCLVYSYDGVHITNQTGATDYTWEKNQLKSNMKEGFAWFTMDSYGFNNQEENAYHEPDVLLMGSSNMEGAQVKASENAGALLNQMLPEYKTYNIGMSGHTLYRCVDNLEKALKTHSPQKYVVLVTDSVDLSIEEMQKVIDKEAEPIPSYDSGLMYHLQKIPAVKVIYKQISDWIYMQGGSSFQESSDNDDSEKENTDAYTAVLKEFLNQASKLVKEQEIPLIIVYQPPQMIEEDGSIAYTHSEEKLELFQKECAAQGIPFHDMTDDFTKLYEEEHLVAHGFSNTQAAGGHLNKYGHKLISEAIVSEIQKLEAE